MKVKRKGRKPQIKQQMKGAIQNDGIQLKRMMWENFLMVLFFYLLSEGRETSPAHWLLAHKRIKNIKT